MLSVEIDKADGIVILAPDGPLSSMDFESASRTIDPYIAEANPLNGLIIHMETFPGWDSFAALSSHLRFVKDHQKKIPRVAFSTESILGSYAEAIGSHFVNAEIKLFSYHELEQARNWVAGNTAGRSS